MNPVNITSLNPINLKTKCGTLSRYAQRYMKSQIKSTSFALERFLGETDSELILQNEQRLKNIGIKQVGRDVKEGVLIADNDYDYRVFLSDDGFLGFDIHKTDNVQVYRHFRINEKNNEYHHSDNFEGLNIEDEMSKVLDFVSDKLYKAKRECTKVPQPFLENKSTSEIVEKANNVLHTTPKNADVKKAGFIGAGEKELIESIKDKHKSIQDLYQKISDCRTKWEVRSGYENYFPQPVTGKLGFKNIGPKGESLSFFRSSYKNNAHDAIIVTDVNGNEQKFVISDSEGNVRKNFVSKYIHSENSGYRVLLTPDYYTQKEIDESNLPVYLSCLNEEMGKFIDYTQGWFDKKAEAKLIRSNYNSATMDQYKDLLDDVHSNFESYRQKMRKYLRKPHKSKKFKTENNISVKLASTAVKFDKITPEGYDLRLSYPKVHDKTATQLLVMRDDKIDNSFYILNNKLLRFKIKDLNDKITHYNQNLYYYDKNYLDNSNLPDYLELLRDKLHDLNKKLDKIREKQVENRIRYHIKTHKEPD